MAEEFSLTDVCRELRVPYGAAWRAIVAGQIDAHRVGGRWVVPASELPAIEAALGRGMKRCRS